MTIGSFHSTKNSTLNTRTPWKSSTESFGTVQWQRAGHVSSGWTIWKAGNSKPIPCRSWSPAEILLENQRAVMVSCLQLLKIVSYSSNPSYLIPSQPCLISLSIRKYKAELFYTLQCWCIDIWLKQIRVDNHHVIENSVFLFIHVQQVLERSWIWLVCHLVMTDRHHLQRAEKVLHYKTHLMRQRMMRRLCLHKR